MPGEERPEISIMDTSTSLRSPDDVKKEHEEMTTTEEDNQPQQSVVSQDIIQKAEQLKLEGNTFLKEFKLNTAIELYTAAIQLHPTAIYHANRAAAHIKTESYGLAIEDATVAISLNKSYLKSYYRRGSSNLALGHYKKALRDFKQVVRMKPRDKDAAAKLKVCEKLVREAAFAMAIESEQNKPMSETIDLESICKFSRTRKGS